MIIVPFLYCNIYWILEISIFNQQIVTNDVIDAIEHGFEWYHLILGILYVSISHKITNGVVNLYPDIIVYV